MKPLPPHLARYVVEQDYGKYTSRDQAVWRFILRQLKAFLSKHAHESYLNGLEQTGIQIETIPRISDISEKLSKFGWSAVPVSGFIPPAAFMELQSLSVLPIASDLRSLEHLMYTPAPDIVHEAAGHAPMLAHPEFSKYLQEYAQVAKKAILSKEDLDQYEAIRELSDLKESPGAKPSEIEAAQAKLNHVSKSLSHISEAAELSRMNWWTSEYGLIGTLQNPKIFGAGLLSSVGESRHCLSAEVKKIPLSLDCIKASYDITEQQPQLFVTPDFKTLSQVLQQFAEQMAFRQGGGPGLQKALEARTVNTVQWDSGLQVGGELCEIMKTPSQDVAYLRFQGPVQIAFQDQQIPGHGTAYHAQGFGSPVGSLANQELVMSRLTATDLTLIGCVPGQAVSLAFQSGVRVEGRFEKAWAAPDGTLKILTFQNAWVKWGERVLFDPAWGTYDMALGASIGSVFGGPPDPEGFGEITSFKANRIPPRVLSETETLSNSQYLHLRGLREEGLKGDGLCERVRALLMTHDLHFADDWLFRIEALELIVNRGQGPAAGQLENKIRADLAQIKTKHPQVRGPIEDGEHLLHEL